MKEEKEESTKPEDGAYVHVSSLCLVDNFIPNFILGRYIHAYQTLECSTSG